MRITADGSLALGSENEIYGVYDVEQTGSYCHWVSGDDGGRLGTGTGVDAQAKVTHVCEQLEAATDCDGEEGNESEKATHDV